jgi:CHAT domain-containing protein
LEEHLKGINTIYYSPVGQLNSVSFGALMKDSLVLADCYSLHLLSSTAEVSDIKQDTNNTIGDAVVYGGIEYDVSDETMLAEARGYDSGNKLFTPLVIDETTRSGWNFLSGTEYEAKNIYAMLDSIGIRTIMYTGSKANEESFKSLSGQSPRLMHIATHGFFLSDPKQVATNPFVQSQENNGQSNFLLRSGLLFAGANKTWVNGANVKGIDDGVLTAEEISKLDLANTQTVVLSACETGLGEVISNEGVFGLQRAFKLAGTQTLIMSLWKVPDVPTSKLMILFYKNWSSGMDVHKAFSEAQKDIKKEFPSPYYWAGFVMLD